MLIISCYFGSKPSGIYPAPAAKDNCVFFSNNLEMKPEAVSKGWQFEYTSHLPLSENTLISSLQSKYVKFLKFLDDYGTMDVKNGIVYFDHKFGVTSDHLTDMLTGCDKEIVIRNTPKYKPTIQHEIDAAMRQERYQYAMPETIDWVGRHTSTGEYSENCRIVNTGLILYRNPASARKLTDQIYTVCWQLAQPECQIIWAVLSQKFEEMIGRLDWERVNPTWQERKPCQVVSCTCGQ
ncbi:MAG: hypothetical protein AB8B64_17825 [Granulosicoccus sp.]